MDIRNAFPSKYVTAGDLQGQEVPVTCDRVCLETVQSDSGRSDELPVLYFQGMGKGLVLNKTNANVIASLYGNETERWQGQPITLYATETEFAGRVVPCVRVRSVPPSIPQASPVVPQSAPVAPPEPVAPTESTTTQQTFPTF